MPPQGAPGLIISGNAKLTSIDLNPEEQGDFYRDLARIASIYTRSRDLGELLMQESETLLAAAAIAKGSIGTNPTFTGLAASGNEIGMQLIRAVTVMSNTGVSGGVFSAAAEVLNWVQTYSSSGWTDVFGSSAHPVDLSSTGISGDPATNLQNRVLLSFVGLLDPVTTPQISEYRFHVGNVDYGVQPIAWQPSTDFFYARLMANFVIPVNTKFWMRGDIQPSTTGGTDATELFGIAFATGDYLSQET